MRDKYIFTPKSELKQKFRIRFKIEKISDNGNALNLEWGLFCGYRLVARFAELKEAKSILKLIIKSEVKK